MDAKSWQRSIYLALFFTFIICAAAFYLIQAARKLNFPPDGRQRNAANNSIECQRQEHAYTDRGQCTASSVNQAHLTPLHGSRARHRFDRR